MKINSVNTNNNHYLTFGKDKYFLYADFDRTLSPLTTHDIFYAKDRDKIDRAKTSFEKMTDVLQRYKDQLVLRITTDRALPELRVMDELYKKQGISIPKAQSVIIKSGSDEWLPADFSFGFPYFRRNKERTRRIIESSKFEPKTVNNFAADMAKSLGMQPVFAITTLSAEKYSPYSVFSHPEMLSPNSIIFRDIGSLKLFYGFCNGIDNKRVNIFKEKIKAFLKRKKINCVFIENHKHPECGNLRTFMIVPIIGDTPLGKNYDVKRAIAAARRNGDTVIAAGDSAGDYAMLNPFNYLEKLPPDCDRMDIKRMMELVKEDRELEKELISLPFISLISQKPEGNEAFLEELLSLLGPHTKYTKVYECKEGYLPDKIKEIIENSTHYLQNK